MAKKTTLDAAVEGAGVLLAHDVLAYRPAYGARRIHFAVRTRVPFCVRKGATKLPKCAGVRHWIKQEIAALDWVKCVGCSRFEIEAKKSGSAQMKQEYP